MWFDPAVVELLRDLTPVAWCSSWWAGTRRWPTDSRRSNGDSATGDGSVTRDDTTASTIRPQPTI